MVCAVAIDRRLYLSFSHLTAECDLVMLGVGSAHVRSTVLRDRKLRLDRVQRRKFLKLRRSGIAVLNRPTLPGMHGQPQERLLGDRVAAHVEGVYRASGLNVQSVAELHPL